MRPDRRHRIGLRSGDEGAISLGGAAGDAVCQHARTEGVLLRPLGNVVVIFPPLAISLAELDRIAAAVERGIVEASRD